MNQIVREQVGSGTIELHYLCSDLLVAQLCLPQLPSLRNRETRAQAMLGLYGEGVP